MNSEKAKYFFFSKSNIITKEFMGIFAVFSSGKKRMSSGFSPSERSLSFEGLLSWALPYEGLLFTKLLSFGRIGISWIPFEIFLSFGKNISNFLMSSTFSIPWLFPICDEISKATFKMFLVFEEIEETSSILIIILSNFSKLLSKRFFVIYDLVHIIYIFLNIFYFFLNHQD